MSENKWRIETSSKHLKSAVILSLNVHGDKSKRMDEDFEIYLTDVYASQTSIDLKQRLASAHGDSLMTSLRGSSIVDAHWMEDALPDTSILVVTFSTGNFACFNGIDGSVIKVGAEATCGQSIIANRRHFF